MAAPKNSEPPSKNEIVRLFLTEAYRINVEEGVVVLDTQEVFNSIGVPFNFDVITYLRKLDFIREESGSMFSLTERGKDMAQME